MDTIVKQHKACSQPGCDNRFRPKNTLGHKDSEEIESQGFDGQSEV